jgi:hypothetical protein
MKGAFAVQAWNLNWYGCWKVHDPGEKGGAVMTNEEIKQSKLMMTSSFRQQEMATTDYWLIATFGWQDRREWAEQEGFVDWRKVPRGTIRWEDARERV